MNRVLFLIVLVALSFAATQVLSNNASFESTLDGIPTFENDQLILPEDLDTWVHLGTMLGPQYTDEGFDPKGQNLFHSALMEPNAYQAFLETGEFADGTMFALLFYDALTELSIQKSGFLMGDLTLTEIHLKDSKRFSSGFNFYVYPPGTEKAEALALPNDCVNCHVEHGAYDGVFTQFYPALRDKIPPQ